jgi:hypothetical protein
MSHASTSFTFSPPAHFLAIPSNRLANLFTGIPVVTNFAYKKRFELAIIGERLRGITITTVIPTIHGGHVSATSI